MNILFTKKFFPDDVTYMKNRFEKGVTILNEEFQKEKLQDLADQADVMLGGLIEKDLIKKASNLKFIQIPWTGVDNIDWELLNELNIPVCNSHSNSFVVAEHAVALLLDASKKLSYHDRQMRTGNWNRLFPEAANPISPFSSTISNSKLGLLGYGAIGSAIHEMLTGFNCSFKVFNRSGKLSQGLEVYSFDSLAENCHDLDFLVIAVPLTEETTGIIDNSIFEALPENCVIVNVSRGLVINEKDLYQALKTNKIGGAAIDTWYNYPNPKRPRVFPSEEFPFQDLDNVVLSPHRAGYVNSGFPHLDDAIQNINNSIRGGKLINVLSTEKKY